MAPASSNDTVADVVLETLAAMVTPEVRVQVLGEAFSLEGCKEIPIDPVRARAFVEGPLRLVIKRRVGVNMSIVLMQTLAPVFGWDVRGTSYDRLPAFHEDQDDVDTDLYDAESIRALRRRLQREQNRTPS